MIFNYLLPDQNDIFIKEMIRLGKPSENIRPLKVVLGEKEIAFSILQQSKELKKVLDTVYIKPDKTKKEREEFDRLLKKKEALKVQYPVEEGENVPPRVVLKKGILSVDGGEVDRFKSPQTLF